MSLFLGLTDTYVLLPDFWRPFFIYNTCGFAACVVPKIAIGKFKVFLFPLNAVAYRGICFCTGVIIQRFGQVSLS